ncbi:ATP-binding protein [Streptomyces sp. Ac-502]|uniref:ATP-binding protein n=1 Tax=Streptomyces sp. Ac-502 TaxID=3342801 RepID=UPI003862C95C
MSVHPARPELAAVPPQGIVPPEQPRRREKWVFRRSDPAPAELAYVKVSVMLRWGWGLPGAVADTAGKAASELADNAMRHTFSHKIAAAVSVSGGRVTVAVLDRGPSRLFPPPEEFGRGLRYVDQHAETWGHGLLCGGTLVRAAFRIGPAAPAEGP